jgi:hypothetical protein
MVYNPARDVLHWSRRDWGTNLHLVTLDTAGGILSDSEVVNGVGDWADCAVDHWDAHYQALSVDPAGRLHMAYNPHLWPAGGDSYKQRNAPYQRVRVQYVYSDDGGHTWRNASGKQLSSPLRADQTGTESGTVLSLEAERGVSIQSMLATSGYVHMVYWSTSANSLKYVRLNRSTGDIDKNVALRESGLLMHTSFVEDAKGRRLYLVGEKQSAKGPCVVSFQETSNEGVTWKEVPVTTPRYATQGGYFATTVYPWLTSDGGIMGLTTDLKIPDQVSYVDPIWFKLQLPSKTAEVVKEGVSSEALPHH